jgi:hypothetical protein
LVNSYNPLTTGSSFSQRRAARIAQREARRRKTQATLDALERRRVTGIARDVSERPDPPVITPSTTPFIPPKQQARFEEEQQRTAEIPFGREVTVGGEGSPRERRGKPEFGSWWGSGVLETLAHGVLPALENYHKGIQAFGGAVTVGKGRQRAFEEVLKEEKYKDRYGFWDFAGQLQVLAETHRRTDLPAGVLDLPGEGINLPGGATLNEIDIGVKGAIELIPEALLIALTGGGGAVGTPLRKAGIVGAKTVGLDIPYAVGKTAKKIVTGHAKSLHRMHLNRVKAAGASPESIARLERMKDYSQRSPRSGQPRPNVEIEERYGKYTKLNPAEADLDSIRTPRLKALIEKSRLAKGPITWTVNLLNPLLLLDKKDKIGRLISLHSRAVPSIDSATEFETGKFFNRLIAANDDAIGAGESPLFEVAKSKAGTGEGLPLYPFKLKVDITKKGFGNITDTGTGMDGQVWTNVFERFFIYQKHKNGARSIKGIKQAFRRNPETKRELELGKEVFASGEIGLDGKTTEYFVRYSGGDKKLDAIATYIRHFHDHLELARINALEMGVKIGSPWKAGTATRTIPRIPIQTWGAKIKEGVEETNQLFKKIKEINTSVARWVIGGKPRVLKPRKYSPDQLQDSVDAGTYDMHDPTSAIREHFRELYKAGVDAQLKKGYNVLAKSKKRAFGEKGTYSENIVEWGTLSRRVTQTVVALKKGKKIRAQTIDRLEKTLEKLDEDGFGAIRKRIETLNDPDHYTPENRIKKLSQLEKMFETKKKNLENDLYWIETPEGNRVPLYASLAFRNKDEVDRILKQHDLYEYKGWRKGLNVSAETLGTIGDHLRQLRTGFDFGVWMLQGFPALGLPAARFAIGDYDTGWKLTKAWGKSIGAGYQGFFKEERIVKTMMENPEITREGIEVGLQLGRSSTDIYNALNQSSSLGKAVTGLTKGQRALPVDPYQLYKNILRRFERAFVGPGDTIRLEYYKILRPMALQSGDPDALRQLANLLNNMTGALSSGASGINKSQQTIERGFLFFSPRYTRACLALAASVFRGDLEGQLARQTLAGMTGLGMATYIGFASALQQEAHLDPSDSRFMTLKIGDDRIGLGGFWIQMAKQTSRIMELPYDADAREQFGGPNALRENPLIRWVRGRSAPAAGVVWDGIVGETYLGQPLQGWPSWTGHVGRQASPIWFESTILDSPYRLGFAGAVTEVLGARTRPLSAAERRRYLRDSIAVEAYDKPWNELNGLERDKVNAGVAPEMTDLDIQSLAELDELIIEQRSAFGEKTDIAVEKYHDRLDKINETWNQEIERAIDFVNEDPFGDSNISLGMFRENFLQASNAIRRTQIEELNDKDGEYAEALKYFDQTKEKFGTENPEDAAYWEYITNIIATDDFDLPTGFDFDARDEKVETFISTWGGEVYAYVQERFRTGREIHDIVVEFWQTKKKFEYYWKEVKEQTLASMPNPEELEQHYRKWDKSTLNEKRELDERIPRLKTYRLKMDAVKKKLREQDKLLDAWLFRWEYTNTLLHPENEISPDGFDDARDYWRNFDLGRDGEWKEIWDVPSGYIMS